VLFLLFHLGPDRYVLDVGKVVEVLPLLQFQKIPQAPRAVAGIFNYHGRPVPAVDLGELILGRPAPERLTTRIILVHYDCDDGRKNLLGLIAENATQVIRREEKDFQAAGLKIGATPYLGPVMLDEHGIIQRVREEKLLPGDVQQLIFPPTMGATA
jgi:chemotaxis-related protein WspB